MNPKSLPGVAVVRSLLDFNPKTGVFNWSVDRGLGIKIKAGNVAGRMMRNGYWQITINGKQYLAHRLAWLHFYGREPKEQIDHINGRKSDNRIENLREATFAENMRNVAITKRNTSGFRGVCYHRRDKIWQASIGFNGKLLHIGSFSTAEQAGAAYSDKARELFGEFYNAA